LTIERVGRADFDPKTPATLENYRTAAHELAGCEAFAIEEAGVARYRLSGPIRLLCRLLQHGGRFQLRILLALR
jgi:hypothetical protein